tara:strand:+ start:541 stop:1335 length:795 start_codon:yes stop_codon:yes gene_type:complete
MNFIQPSIDPVIFSLNFVELRWYSLAYIFGIILGILIMKKLNKIRGNLITEEKIDSFFIWGVLGIILGGRIGYVLFYQFKVFINDPIYIFKIWNGGMSFHGGLFGIIISIYLFSIFHKIKFYYLSDLVSVVAPIGLFLGRLANFINTELIGRPTEFYISVIYPSVDNLQRHPSQLYEAFFEGFLLFFILLFYFLRKNIFYKNGFISGLFLTFYALFRFLIEFLREPDSHMGLFYNLISMGQILSIPLFIFGIILIKLNGYKRRY